MDNMNKYYTLWKFRVLTKETVPQIAADRAGWRSTWHRKDWVLRKKFKQWFILEFNVLSTIVIYSGVLYIVLYQIHTMFNFIKCINVNLTYLYIFLTPKLVHLAQKCTSKISVHALSSQKNISTCHSIKSWPPRSPPHFTSKPKQSPQNNIFQ